MIKWKCIYTAQKIIDTRVYMHFIFITILINKLQNIVMYSSRKFNSPFNEWWIAWLRFIWETHHLLEWDTPKFKVTKLSHLRKKSLQNYAVFNILINKLQFIEMYSSRQFNSPFNERRIVLLRLFLGTQQLVELHTPDVKVTKWQQWSLIQQINHVCG